MSPRSSKFFRRSTLTGWLLGFLCLACICILPFAGGGGGVRTPVPTYNVNNIQTYIVNTAAAAISQTGMANYSTQQISSISSPTETVTLIPVPSSILQNMPTPFPTEPSFFYVLPIQPTETESIYDIPILETYPVPASSSGSDGGCCKHCTSGQPCGDSCISSSYTCHQPPGCACY